MAASCSEKNASSMRVALRAPRHFGMDQPAAFPKSSQDFIAVSLNRSTGRTSLGSLLRCNNMASRRSALSLSNGLALSIVRTTLKGGRRSGRDGWGVDVMRIIGTSRLQRKS